VDHEDWLWRLDCLQQEMDRLPEASAINVLFSLKINSNTSSSEEWRTFPFGTPVFMSNVCAPKYEDPQTGAVWFALGPGELPFVVCWDSDEGWSVHDALPLPPADHEDVPVFLPTLGWTTWYYVKGEQLLAETHDEYSLQSRLVEIEEGVLETCALAPHAVKRDFGAFSVLGSWPTVLFYLALKRAHPLLAAWGRHVPKHPMEHDGEETTFSELNDRVIFICPELVTATRYAFDAMRRPAAREEPERSGPQAPIALDWERLSAEGFERLVFWLIAGAPGYENPEWLTRTNAPDRGRDLAATRVYKDPLSGTLRSRIVVQCRHWLSRSIGPADLTQARDQMSLWQPPRVDVLIMATSGRFTADAVALIEQNNQSDRSMRIEMWPETHLERLLADRQDLIERFNLANTESGGDI